MDKKTSLISRAGLVLAGVVILGGCGGDDVSGPPQLPIPSDADAGAAARPQVTMRVSNDDDIDVDIVITLVPELAPTTVANFLEYVENGFYNGTVIHRYQPSFVLQGGGYAAPVVPEELPEPKPRLDAIPLEVKVSNVYGTVAMARTAQRDSATSEFFININNNTQLNTLGGGYAAFGYVSNMAPVVQLLESECVDAEITGNGFYGCLPVPNLVILSATKTR